MVRNKNVTASVVLSRSEDASEWYLAAHSHVIGRCDDKGGGNGNDNGNVDGDDLGGELLRRRRDLVSILISELLASTRAAVTGEDYLSLACVRQSGCGNIPNISRNDAGGRFVGEVLMEGILGDMSMRSSSTRSSTGKDTVKRQLDDPSDQIREPE